MIFSNKGAQKIKLNAQNQYRKTNARRFYTQSDQQHPYGNLNLNQNKPQSRLNIKSSEKNTNRLKIVDPSIKNTQNSAYRNQPYHNLGAQQYKYQKYQRSQKNEKSEKSVHNGNGFVHLGYHQQQKQNKEPTRKTTFKLHAYKNLHGNRYLKTQPDQHSSQQQKIPPTATDTKATTIGVFKYEIDGTAGKGTFGVVYEGHIKGTGQKIAIKKVLQDKRYKNRELQILKMLKNPSILQMKDHFMTQQEQNQYLNVVMDYYQQNLYQAVKRRQINAFSIKIFAFQLLRGLNYLKTLSIAHRDIKPQNILVDRVKNNVVICDFGSAKQLVKGQANLAYICSRCYRAPQLIFGATDYNSQIDMWSLGCVIVQMINGDPPFLGDSQIDQLFQIVKILGTPSTEDTLQMNHKYDIKQLSKFPKIKPTQWKSILKTKDSKLIDLVTQVLCYSPLKRLTPAEAMAHTYFDDLKNQKKYKQLCLKIKNIPSQMFQFSHEQLKSFRQEDLLDRIVPEWLHKQKQSSNPNIFEDSQKCYENEFISNGQTLRSRPVRGHTRNYSEITSSHKNQTSGFDSGTMHPLAQSNQLLYVHAIHNPTHSHTKNQGSYHGTGYSQQNQIHQTQVAYNYGMHGNYGGLNSNSSNQTSALLAKIHTGSVNLSNNDARKSYGVKKPAFLNKQKPELSNY